MNISFFPYQLVPKARLGAKAEPKPREGALLRVEHDGIGVGFSDLHPWPELGDESLEKQLQSLKMEKPLSLAKRSLQLSMLDANARNDGVFLLKNKVIPKSHYLISDLRAFSEETRELLFLQGFSKLKVKMGLDLNWELSFLEDLAKPFEKAGIKFRLDFNLGLDELAAYRLLHRMSDRLKERIDFLEDPFPYHPESWAQFRAKEGVPLALDRFDALSFPLDLDAVDVLVLKPAIMDPSFVKAYEHFAEKRIVITSYLAHPLDQLSAAYAAALFHEEMPNTLDDCGLISHVSYQENSFSSQLAVDGAKLVPPKGLGFGYQTTFLESQEWREIL
ncbi:MAG: hypothetical protein COX62_00770 [Deltaproteobacteria bacterium CG_4_10_14_0_2_um_filter_43_8]|nr:MAG: hypothetical protein COV43_06960 [Deltaproteobacteria bacterium CG11_big_fil_rev_8_21_14_0_20_42_23]PJA22076.1 MAG: hypothetical protein COX62_00770 [Deltaproteobacteria bacterium CG_4_10_14_0_2_um_filter_43_8]PJC65254.1 MAG: hypothetical protein CO021_00265 [Deltaproteobacteria bacterium CG_4_9_14_0_2_um_filter_42_21]